MSRLDYREGDVVCRKDQPEITATIRGLKMSCASVRLPSGRISYWAYDEFETADALALLCRSATRVSICLSSE